MWRLLPWRRQVYVVTLLAIVLAWALDAAAEWLQGERAPLLKFASFVAIVITIGAAGIASATWRWVWRRFPVLARKTFPDLTGTWEGTLVSTWIDPATSKPPSAIAAELWIRQGFFSMSIKMRTEEFDLVFDALRAGALPGSRTLSRVVLLRQPPQGGGRIQERTTRGCRVAGDGHRFRARSPGRPVLHRPPNQRRHDIPSSESQTEAGQTVPDDLKSKQCPPRRDPRAGTRAH